MRVLFLDDDSDILADGLADLDGDRYPVSKCLTIERAMEALTNPDGSITGDPNVVGPATAACVVLIVLMIVGALLLLASPYISYKLAFGQIFEAVSATAAGWMGALTATGIEIAGIALVLAGVAVQERDELPETPAEPS